MGHFGTNFRIVLGNLFNSSNLLVVFGNSTVYLFLYASYCKQGQPHNKSAYRDDVLLFTICTLPEPHKVERSSLRKKEEP